MHKLRSVAELERFRSRIVGQRNGKKKYVSVCGGTGCHAYKCEDVARALENEILPDLGATLYPWLPVR